MYLTIKYLIVELSKNLFVLSCIFYVNIFMNHGILFFTENFSLMSCIILLRPLDGFSTQHHYCMSSQSSFFASILEIVKSL